MVLHALPAEVLGRVVEWLQHLRVVDRSDFGRDKRIVYGAPGAALPPLALSDYFNSVGWSLGSLRDLEALKCASKTLGAKLRECRPVIAVGVEYSIAEALACQLYGTWRVGHLVLAGKISGFAGDGFVFDWCLEHLTALSSLHMLDLRQADLLSDGGEALDDERARQRMASIRLLQLRRLSLRDARFHLEHLALAHLPRLEALVVSSSALEDGEDDPCWGGRVDDAGVVKVLQAFPTLRCLDLSDSGLDSATAQALVTHCPDLRELDFCLDPTLDALNHEGVRVLAQLQQLSALRLAVPHDLSVLHAYPSLTHLDLACYGHAYKAAKGEARLGDADITALVQGCVCLRTLRLWGDIASPSDACASELRALLASRHGTGCSIELYD